MQLQYRPFGAEILRAPDDAAASGPLSVAQAVGLLSTPERKAPEAADNGSAPEAAADEQSEAVPTAEDAPDPETPAIGGEGEEAEPESDPETPAIAAPRSWAAEDKATFATLPREAQEIILAREDARDRAVTKAQQEAADVRKAAECEIATIGSYRSQLDQLVAQASQTFAGKWGENPDWVAAANEIGVEETTRLKLQYDAEMAELHRVAQAQQQASQAEYAAFLKSEGEILPSVVPDLADPEKGPARRAELANFLRSEGYADDNIRWASAGQLALAYDAMRFRQAQAGARTAAQAKPRPTTQPVQQRQGGTVRPSASAPAAPPRERAVAEARNRFAQRPTTDNAAAAILALSKG